MVPLPFRRRTLTPPMPRHIPDSVQNIHLMAICGTGMGAFAGLLQEAGYRVAGSDAGVYPPMSDQLEQAGIRLMEGFAAKNLDWKPDLVVVGNAISKPNVENQALLERDLPYASFPETLGALFLRKRHPVVVTGTHGKTTTCSVLAWALHALGTHNGFLVGGVLENFGRNFRVGDEGAPFVIEGDEYDTAWFEKTPKFLHYMPRTAIMTSVEFDHADIYRDLEHVRQAFRAFVDLIPPDGLLVACADGVEVPPIAERCAGRLELYSTRGHADAAWQGSVIDADRDGMTFAVHHDGAEFGRFRCTLVGEHNLANLTAVVAVLAGHGHSAAAIADALAGYKGVKRRQTVFGEPRGITLIDDFAHHPTAVSATIEATRLRFGDRKLWVVFEPRTNTTRRAVFQEAYGSAFVGADELLVAPVDRPEKAPGGDRFDVDQLVSDVIAGGTGARRLDSVDAIVAHLAANSAPGDVVLILSNGGFGGIYAALPAAVEAAGR